LNKNKLFSVAQGALLGLSFKNNNMSAETNLFNNKSLSVFIPLEDKVFFSYFVFNRKDF